MSRLLPSLALAVIAAAAATGPASPGSAVSVGKALAAALRLAPGRNPAVEDRTDPWWRNAAAEVSREPAFRGRALPILTMGSSDRREIALTFDDGPHPAFTPQILAALRRLNVPATFFVVGKAAEKRPDLVRAMVADGHEVGDHTFSHVTLTRVSPADARTEYRADADLVARITGRRPRWCRPPGGDLDAATLAAAEAEGLTTVLWTDDPGDYANPTPDALLDRTLRRLHNGAILLMHDGPRSTIAIIPRLVAAARTLGYRFVSLADLTRPDRIELASAPGLRRRTGRGTAAVAPVRNSGSPRTEPSRPR